MKWESIPGGEGKNRGEPVPLESLFRPSGQNSEKIPLPFQIISGDFRKAVLLFSRYEALESQEK